MKDLREGKILRGLNQTAIFKSLPDDVLIKLSKKAGIEAFSPEEVIVWEGEPSDRLFIIINGIVTVKRVIPNKSDKIFAYLLPGSTFGEVGILENKSRSATVAALTDVEALVFDRDYFLKILHEHPTVAIELAKLLGQYLTESNKRITRGDKEKKVVLVFDLFNIHGAAELGKRLAIRLKKGSDKGTIYAEYPFKGTLSAALDLSKVKSNIFHHDSGLDILLENDKSGATNNSKIALMVDNLLYTYENLVIYLNQDFNESLSQILENIDQVIVVGSSEKSHWEEISNLHRSIKSQVQDNNTKIFTILINNDPTDNFNVYPPPDFKVVFSDETTDYQLWSDGNSKLASESFHEAVETFVDRLQRNNQIGIFIPTTFDVNNYLDTTEYIDRTLAFLGERFGGATSEEAKGIWNSEEIGLVGEKLFKVHTYATSRDLKKFLDEVVEFVSVIKVELKQEAMAIEINQKLTLI
ncbi:MAG: cyclic nucleotide-binding domain-containing protein [Cyclobacteriaceae bacterium]|nr:cyclic nucleotide-binding domain-containing protein [Cyclobacteriaceae bacterium]